MASTYSQWALLEKVEQGAVGYKTAEDNCKDTIDLGISGNYFVAGIAESINVYQLVAFDPGSVGKVVKAKSTSSLSTIRHARGIALASSSYAGTTVPVLTRGIVDNPSWAWTTGQKLFLGSVPGALVQEGDTSIYQYVGIDPEIYYQPVGVAIGPTRVMFDFQHHMRSVPYIVQSRAGFESAAAISPAYGAVTGPGKAYFFSCTGGNRTLVFPFMVPVNFGLLPNIGAWGFRIYYRISSAGASIGNATIYDSAGNTTTLTLTAGSSSSWTTFDIPMSALRVSPLTYNKGTTFYVELAISSAAGTAQVAAFADFRYIPEDGTFE